jgi:ADP-ribosyl-[dinitrogen reductase] hydrolase
MARLKRSHRCAGLVIGAAVGDALGAPFEFRRAGSYKQHFPTSEYGGIGELIGGGTFDWLPGEFTDDTQMAMSLALSILECGGFDPDHVWSYWQSWADNANDIGNTTRHSLSFDNWRDVSHSNPETTAANGALMRAFPLALLDKSKDELQEIVLLQGEMTHPHPAARWGAWLGVAMMHSAIHGNDPFATLDEELELLPKDVAEKFKPLLTPDWEPAVDRINNGSVWGCLADAVWAVRNSSSFEEAVINAVNLGDDADTVGCVAGALAGAMYGIQAIPSRWTTYLNGVVDTPNGTESFGNARLNEISRKLANLSSPPEVDDETPAGPEEVEERLFAANRSGAVQAPQDWAVVSLCLVGDRFKNHEFRREIYLIDQPGDANPSLDLAVSDAVKSIDAFLNEGHNVLVHCHGGRSRTGLILKAWKMNKEGWSGSDGEKQAHEWLSKKWGLYRNTHFKDFLKNDWN